MGWNSFNAERKWLILAGVLICGGGQGVLLNTLSVFIKPVTEALSFSRGAFTLYASITSLTATFMLPLYGELYQKPYFHKLMLACALICGLIPFGYSLCTSLRGFYILAAVLGVFFQGVSITGVSTVLNRWFRRSRGFASGICFAGSGVFAALLLWISGDVIRRWGWRWGYRVIGASSLLFLAAGAGIVYILERGGVPWSGNDPEFMEAAARPAGQDLTRQEALRTQSFWGILTAGFTLALITQAGGSSIAAYLADLGYTGTFQSRLASAGMLSLAAGKIFVGKLLDRKGLRAGLLLVAAGIVNFLIMGLVMLLPHGFRSLTLESLSAMLPPILFFLCLGAAGLLLGGVVMGRILKVDWRLASAASLSAMFGYPLTEIISRSVVASYDLPPEEEEKLLEAVMPQLIIAGFTTVTVASVALAGFIAPVIFN